jgi:predicted GTPase
VENGEQIRGKRVLVIEDGPTVTHGGMPYGAGVVTAEKFGAAEIVDPRPFAVESIAATYVKYPHMVKILPAMGYGDKQVADLAATIEKADCDLIISATPIDLNRLIKTRKPMLSVGYDLEEIGSPTLEDVLAKF